MAWAGATFTALSLAGFCQMLTPQPPGQHEGRTEWQGEPFRTRAAQMLCPLTLIIEAVDAVDTGTLVVPTEQEEVLRVLDLIGQQQADGLQRLLAPVHVVPQEQVVTLWREATVLEQPQKIIVLAMNVTCDPGNQVSTRASLNVNLLPRRNLGGVGGKAAFRRPRGPGLGAHRRS